MRRSGLLLPMLGLLLLGTGCALSSADADRQVTNKVSDSGVLPSAKIVSAANPDAAAGPAATLTDSTDVAVSMTAGNFYFRPNIIKAKPGQKVTVTMTANAGTHDFVLDEANVKKSVDIGTIIEITAPTVPGHYTYYSDVGADKTLGMVGDLIVE